VTRGETKTFWCVLRTPFILWLPFALLLASALNLYSYMYQLL